jgi:hypothetical protein
MSRPECGDDTGGHRAETEGIVDRGHPIPDLCVIAIRVRGGWGAINLSAMARKPLPRLQPRDYLPRDRTDRAGVDARSRTASSCQRLESSPCDSSVLSPRP